MPSIDVQRKRIRCKIVYYGPGLSGKTANLRYVYEHLDRGVRGRLVSLTARSEGSQRIDLLPLKLGKLKGFDVIYNACTAPGQAIYNKTRKLVLKGADGVVFVADSRRNRLVANIDSFRNLRENLEAYDTRLEDLPHVVQYNKRDLNGVLPASELRAHLNPYGVLEFEASTVTGQGVMETLRAVLQLVREDIERRL